MYLQLEIHADRIDLTVTAEQWTLLPWIGFEPETTYEEAFTPAEDAEVLAQARAFFSASEHFSVDGDSAPPHVTDVEVLPPFSNGLGGPGIMIKARLECAGQPQRVGVLWDRWDGVDGENGPAIPILFRADGEFEFSVVKPTEPESVWHTADRSRRARELPSAVGLVEGARFQIPLVSVALILAGALGLRMLRARPRIAWAFATVALAGVVVCRDVARVGVASPFRPRVTMPSPDQARAMFETLHANVYAAFAATSEDEIYDLLAVSVSQELLDELYGEVYESLILRSDGGAVCRIEEVRLLGGKVDLNPAAVEDATGNEARAHEFAVDWSWEVDGLVSHWGHVHRRTNRYQALYTVAHDGASWKIAGVETTEHVRIDDDGEAVRMKGFDDSIDELVPPRRK